MTGKSHIAIGLITVTVMERFASVRLPQIDTGYGITIPGEVAVVATYLAAVVASLAPDIDHASSSITNKVWGRGLVNKIFGTAFRALLGGHRALTHSIFAIGTLAAVWLMQVFLSMPFHGLMAAVLAAYTSHVVADMLTKDGVKLMYPVSDEDFGIGPKAMRFKTGSVFEYLTVAAYLLGGLGVYFFTL